MVALEAATWEVVLTKPKRSGWFSKPPPAGVEVFPCSWGVAPVRLNKLLRDWNKSEPDKAVQVNDLITACNGVSGDPVEIMRAMMQSRTLMLTLSRPVAMTV